MAIGPQNKAFKKLVAEHGEETAKKLLEQIQLESGELPPPNWSWNGPEWEDNSKFWNTGGFIKGPIEVIPSGTKPSMMHMSPKTYQKLKEIYDAHEFGEKIHIEFGEAEMGKTFNNVETISEDPKQLGDDRAPRYNWTPEQLEKADPSHPDPELQMPPLVMELLQEREKLAGREPIPEGEDDIDSDG